MVIKIKREDLKNLQFLQENIMKEDECEDDTPLNFSDATAFKFNNKEPYIMRVQYSYCDI
jgi:hypothetical protein